MGKIEDDDLSLTTDTDESYSLKIQRVIKDDPGQNVDNVIVIINAKTYFGARHALETLSQMIGYDDLSDTLLIYKNAQIQDTPKFAHRGVLLDSSRNFMTKEVIKKIIRGMS